MKRFASWIKQDPDNLVGFGCAVVAAMALINEMLYWNVL